MVTARRLTNDETTRFDPSVISSGGIDRGAKAPCSTTKCVSANSVDDMNSNFHAMRSARIACVISKRAEPEYSSLTFRTATTSCKWRADAPSFTVHRSVESPRFAACGDRFVTTSSTV